MSQGTYYEKRQYLEKLGWIKIIRRGFDKPCMVTPTKGKDDPDYENRSWAKWHPSNRPAIDWSDNEGLSEEI
jgi:hypothetical protein